MSNQSGQRRPSVEELQTYISALTGQRNVALDQVAELSTRLHLALQDVKRLKEQVELLEEKIRSDSPDIPDDVGDPE